MRNIGKRLDNGSFTNRNMMKNIATALVAAQKKFSPALKTSINPHFKSKYADLSACVEAVIDGLNSAGIALVQKTRPHDNGVVVETVFLHESGETISSGELFVPAQKHDAQGFGSALTYARRYSLMAACGIAPEDDDGNAAQKTVSQPHNPVASAICESVKAGDLIKAFQLWQSEKTQEARKTIWHLLDKESKEAIRTKIEATKESE